MGTLRLIRCCLLLMTVIYMSSTYSFAKRSGGGSMGGGRTSSGGSFGRSGGFGRASGGGGFRSSNWRSSGGGFGGGSRTSYSRSSPSAGGYGGGGGATRYGSASPSGSSGRYGGGAATSYGGGASSRAAAPAAATRYGGAAPSASATRYGAAAPSSPSATRYGGGTASGGSATRYSGAASSPSGRIGTGTALGAGAAGGAIGATRYGGGSYGSLGSSAGRVGASPTLTRYGTQQSSGGGGVYGSSGAAGGSRWGSSAASGRASPMDSMRNRFTGTSGGAAVRQPSVGARQPVAGNARPNYGGASNRYTPQVQAPAATRSQPTKVVYSTTYNNYHNSGSRYGTSGFGGGSSYLGGTRKGYGTGTLIATGLAAGVGGYALGRMMSGGYSRFGYGGYGGYPYGGYGGYGYGGGYGYPYGGYPAGCLTCSPFTTYVPYRDRYQEYYPPAPTQQAPQPAVDQYNPNNNQDPVGGGQVNSGSQAPPQTSTDAPKTVDLCMLARWNRELAFAELPNMALDFLANNNVSGNSTSDKAKFMYDFLTVSVDAYDQYNNSADIFAIPPTFDMNTCNMKVSKTSLMNSANAVQAEEPIMTSLRHMLSIYSNKSVDQDALRDVVEAAKVCLPQGPTVTSPEVLGCIDFSLSPEQLLKLDVPHSMFGSSEICRRQLNPDMFKCVPKAAGSPCRIEHLTRLNLFARNFYLCSEAMDDATQNGQPAAATPAPYVPYTTPRHVIYITTAKPSFWSRIFG